MKNSHEFTNQYKFVTSWLLIDVLALPAARAVRCNLLDLKGFQNLSGLQKDFRFHP
jgi:hypothetical protein